MHIEDNKIVTFFYQINDQQGASLEGNREGMPMAYLHGHGNLLKALEAEMTGKQKGDQFEVTLSPEQAYGPRKNDAEQKVPIKHLASKHKKLLPGTIVKVNTEKGVLDAQVIKAGKFMVTIDMNHPFAGRTLVFNIDVTSVRDATEEELSHGHAHGEGGHHH
ncbi:MAG: peptidylprolyl isomerase [Alteromonadaceae bacterium]|nr:MAG: peptidylprolyl isomerase [Alteromonadaceae bacterium]